MGGGRILQRSQGSSNSCQQNLEFHLNIHLDFTFHWRVSIFILTQKSVLFPSSWSHWGTRKVFSFTLSFDTSLNLRLNSWYTFFTSPGNSLGEEQFFQSLLRVSQDGNLSFWITGSVTRPHLLPAMFLNFPGAMFLNFPLLRCLRKGPSTRVTQPKRSPLGRCQRAWAFAGIKDPGWSRKLIHGNAAETSQQRSQWKSEKSKTSEAPWQQQ